MTPPHHYDGIDGTNANETRDPINKAPYTNTKHASGCPARTQEGGRCICSVQPLSELPDGQADGLSPAARARTRQRYYRDGKIDVLTLEEERAQNLKEAIAQEGEGDALVGMQPDRASAGYPTDAIYPLRDASTPMRNDGANSHQVGGEHYGLSPYQHWDLVAQFDLDYFQGQITKYVMRWKKKNGLTDLQKAKHFLEKYIELVEGGSIK